MIDVIETQHGRAAIATTPIAAGTDLGELQGEHRSTPSRWTLQIGPDVHVEPAPDTWWRYADHSCRPSAAVVDRRIVTVLALAPGEKITIDYEKTETICAEPFDCRCGEPTCRLWIVGKGETDAL